MSNQVITFGCRLNSYESEAIKNALTQSKENNLIVFNSCAVTSESERQLRQAIRKQSRANPGSKIIVTGCAAQINPEKYAAMPEVAMVLGNSEKTKSENYLISAPKKSAKLIQQNKQSPNQDLTTIHQDKLFSENQKITLFNHELEEKILVNDIMSISETASHMVTTFENHSRAFVQIQNGCNHRCTFCIIPYGRGNSRSVPLGEIVLQIQKLVANGYKEIVLTGVDISDYGKDLPARLSLASMIKRLLKLVPELPRLRLSSIDVAEIDQDLIDIIANEARFMPYLHISLQSGDDMILKRMKRRHNRKQVLDFCEQIRKLRKDVTFGSDIIAGFPTETEEMFLNTLNLISEAGIIFNHIFPYSIRDGTPAAKMPQIPSPVKKERAKLLRQAGSEQLDKFLDTMIGTKQKVLVEEKNGRCENFVSVKIDHFQKNTSLKSDDNKINKIIEVMVRSKNNGLLVAESNF